MRHPDVDIAVPKQDLDWLMRCANRVITDMERRNLERKAEGKKYSWTAVKTAKKRFRQVLRTVRATIAPLEEREEGTAV